jgi:hypothetical protein
MNFLNAFELVDDFVVEDFSREMLVSALCEACLNPKWKMVKPYKTNQR